MALSEIPFQQTQQRSPFGQTDWTGNTVTTTYDPRLLDDFWAQTDQRQNQRNVYGTAAQNAYDAMTGANADPRSGLNPLVAGLAPTSVQTGYSRAGFQNIPGASDFGGERQRVEDAMFGQFASRADDRYGREQTALETQLREQGFTPGAEGWDDALGTFTQGKNDAYQQAAYNAQLAGGAEQSRMLADALRIRGQQGAEGQQDVTNFNNAMGMNFGQRATAGQFANQARQQQFGENTGAAGQAQNWLQTAGGQLPQGTMLPNFDLGMRNLDEGQANQNQTTAWLSDLFGPMLAGGLSSLFDGGGGSGGGGGTGGLGGLLGGLGNLGNLFSGTGSGSWLDGLLNPAMDPSQAYGPDSGWGEDVWPMDLSYDDWFGNYWD